MKLTIPLLAVKILIDCIKTKYKKNYDEKKFTWIIDMIDDNFLVLDVFSNRQSQSKKKPPKVREPKASWMVFFDSTSAAKNYLINSIKKGDFGVLQTVPISVLIKHSKLRKEMIDSFETHLKSLGELSKNDIETLVSNVVQHKTTLFNSILDVNIQSDGDDDPLSETSEDAPIKVVVNHSKLIPHSELFADWLFGSQVFILDIEAIKSKNGLDRLVVSDFKLFTDMFETNFLYVAEEMDLDHNRFDKLQKYFNSFFGLPENVYDLNVPDIVFKNIPKVHVVKII